MASLLQQLENNEAILLMYLADELPPEDRLEVEAMLQTDSNLAVELERLAAVHERVRREMDDLDRSVRLAAEPVGLRRVRQEMAQWAAEREREAASVDQRRRRFPWWGYPIAAAASVGLVFLIWWGALPGDSATYMPGEEIASIDEGEFMLPQEDPVVAMAADLMETGLLNEELAELRETEQALQALQALRLDLVGLEEGRL